MTDRCSDAISCSEISMHHTLRLYTAGYRRGTFTSSEKKQRPWKKPILS